jgi:hypothetical protein
MKAKTKQVQQQKAVSWSAHNPRKDKMKARRKMSEEEKDRRLMARCDRKMLAAQRAVCCSACGEAGKILWNHECGEQPPLTSAPPLWLVEHSWLLEVRPLCFQCIETHKRAELCFEGGDLHDFWELEGRRACIDCGMGEECENETPAMVDRLALVCARLKSAIAARAAEIRELAEWMDADVLSGPGRDATAQRIKHLRADLRWRERRLAEESMYLYGPKDGVLH